MRKALILFFFLFACTSTEPAPVQVIGAPDELVPIAGEWAGSYESAATGRSGSISFHLTEDPRGAHGDVLMIPRHDVVVRGEDQRPRPMTSAAEVLTIEFVRIAAGEVTGRIAPYPDPESEGAMAETHFAGRVDGDWIEGTFVTYSDRGVGPRRGTWRVHRKSVK